MKLAFSHFLVNTLCGAERKRREPEGWSVKTLRKVFLPLLSVQKAGRAANCFLQQLWDLTGDFLDQRAELLLLSEDQGESSHQLSLQLVQLPLFHILMGLSSQGVQIDQQEDQLIRPTLVLPEPGPGRRAVLASAGLHQGQQLPQHGRKIRVAQSLWCEDATHTIKRMSLKSRFHALFPINKHNRDPKSKVKNSNLHQYLNFSADLSLIKLL